MKNLWQTFIVLGLLLVVLQAPDLNEAKKIKKLVKELKKLKKYAYLLAATKKKLYAIPFPMPLPVFVKRQHIYTQVPIIPRYVQHPQPYGSPASHSESSSSYELMSDSSPVSVYPKGYSSAHKKPSSSSGSSDFASQYLGNSVKYLSSIASLLGQATPMSGSASKDLLGKFLNGQARLLPPTALLSSIKSKGLSGGIQTVKQSDQEQQQEQHDDDSKSHSSSGSSSSSSSSSSGAVTYDEAPPSKATSKQPESTTENKPSASEVYKSAIAFKAMRPMYAAASLMNPYQFPQMMAPMMAPMMSPMAALVAANRAQAMASRLPVMRAPFVPGMLDQYDGGNHLGEAQETQEISTSSSQDHETVSRDYPINLAAFLRHRQIQEQHLRNQQPPEQALLAMQNLQREQLLARRQRAIKSALLREHEVASRLAESRQILARAHQMGLPIAPSVQQNLLANYGRQLVV